MVISDIILIPVYVFLVLLIIKILHIDAWIDWFLKIFKMPNHLERRITELENRVKKLESNI